MQQAMELKKVSPFQPLMDRYDELLELGRANPNEVSYLMEMDCLNHLFECEGLTTYGKMASFCKEKHIQRVVDIGCAYGHQSQAFLNQGLSYVGVSDAPHAFWKADTSEYLVGHYPCEVPVQSGDLAVSVLCLTWNCYLHEGEKTLTAQCESLQRDFDHCLLYMVDERVEFVSRYFKRTEKLGDRLYYFSN